MWAVILIPAILSVPAPLRAAPLETYGRLPSLEDVALSPSGTRIAFVRTKENLRVIAKDEAKGLLMIAGAVPGATNATVTVRRAKSHATKKKTR